MSASDIERVRRELADYDARQAAAKLGSRPGWRIALDDLFVANYHNDAFWFGAGNPPEDGLVNTMHGHVSDEDMATIRQWYAGKCRTCQRPMHVTDVRRGCCRTCGAISDRPDVVEGSVIPGGHLR